MAAFSCQKTSELLREKSPALSLLHLNIRSLRKHQDDLVALISLLKHSFSVICLSETWLSGNEGNLYGLPGYYSEYCNRELCRGGGSAILVNSSLTYTRRSDITFNNILCESVWLEFNHSVIPLNSRSTIIASIYRSPSSSYSDFCNQLSIILNNLVRENKKVVLCGDFNTKIIDPDSASCLEYMNCLYCFGFTSHISAPTRNDLLGSNTLIDHIISNISTEHVANVIDHSITDHNPVFFILGSENTKASNIFTKRRFVADKRSRLDIGD